MSFEGFTREDFEVFRVEGFQDRMPLLRQRITPKLKMLGEALTPRMSKTLGELVHPHTALHMRRTVNAPVETWVAFARTARAYKPSVHIRAAISLIGVRVMVFVEDYADDKELFIENIRSNADTLADSLAKRPTILAYDMPDETGKIRQGKSITAESIREFAERMSRVKGQHARFGIAFSRRLKLVGEGDRLMNSIVKATKLLRPIYDCGKS